MAQLPEKKEGEKDDPNRKHFYNQRQRTIVTRQGQIVMEEVTKKPDPSMIGIVVKKLLQRKMSFYMLLIARYARDNDKRYNGVQLMNSILSSRLKRFQTASLRKINAVICQEKNKRCLVLLMEMLFNYKQMNQKKFTFRKLKENLALMRSNFDYDESRLLKYTNQIAYKTLPQKRSDRQVKSASKVPKPPRDLSERKANSSQKKLSKTKKEKQKSLEEIPRQTVSQIQDNEEFQKLLKLTPEARQALLKVQRFDRFIYAKEAEKACKQIITSEVKRIEKLKNQNKTMRQRLFDNQLTITALYNMLRLLNEMNREYGIVKVEGEEEEGKGKGEEKLQRSRSRAASREKRKRQQIVTDIERLLKQIQKCITTEKDEKKLEQLLRELIVKYENQEPIHSQIHIYRALMQSIAGQQLKFQHEEALIQSISELSMSDSQQGLQKMKKNRESLVRQKKFIPSDAVGLLKKLQNLDKLYNLIIGWYERQWTWKKKTRQKLLMKEDKQKQEEKIKESVKKLENEMAKLQSENNKLKQENSELQLLKNNYDQLDKKIKQIKDKLMMEKDITRDEYQLKNGIPFKSMSLSLNMSEIMQKLEKEKKEKLSKLEKDFIEKMKEFTRKNREDDKRGDQKIKSLNEKYEKLMEKLENQKKKEIQRVKNQQNSKWQKRAKDLVQKVKDKEGQVEKIKNQMMEQEDMKFKELEKKYEIVLKKNKQTESKKDKQIQSLKNQLKDLEKKMNEMRKKWGQNGRQREMEKKYQEMEKKLAMEEQEQKNIKKQRVKKQLQEKVKEKEKQIERLRSENSAEWEFTFKELEKKYEALLKRFKDAEADKEAEIGQLKTNIRHLQAKSRDKAKKGPADEQIETRKKELEKKYQDLEKKLADEQYEAQIAQMDKLRKELEEKLKEKDAEIERLRSENSAEWEFTFKELEKKYEALMKRFKDAEAEKEAEIDHLKSANRQLEAKSRDKAKKGPADEQIETRKKELEKKYQDLEKKLADEQYEAQIAQMDKLRKELEEKLKEKDAEIERLRSENSAEWEFTFKELEKKYEALMKRFKDAEAEKEAEIAHLKSANRQLEAKSRDKAKKGPADEQIETRKKELEKKYQDLEKKLADEQYEAQIAQMDKLRKELEEKLKEKDAEIERLRSENSAEWEFTFKELEKKYEALMKRFKDAEAEKEAEIAHLKSANRQLEAKSRDKAKKGPADEQIETRKKELEKKYQDLEKKLADEQYEAQIAQMDKLRKELEEKLKEKDAEIERLRSENSAEWEFTFKELEKKYEALLKRFKDAEADKEAEIGQLKTNIRHLQAKSRDKAKKGPADEQIETRKKELEKKYQDLEKKLADEQYEAQIAQMDKLRKELEEKLKEKDAEIERLRSENSAEWEFTFKELEKKYEALMKRFKDAETEKEAEIDHLKSANRQLEAKSRDKAKKGPADEQIETRKKELEKKYQDLEKKLADEQYEAQIAQMDKLRKELEEKLKEKDAEIERLRSENSAEWEFTFKELEKKYEALLKRFKDAEADKEAEIGQLKTNIRHLQAKSRDKAKKGPADEQIETRKKELEKKYQDLEKKLADEQYEAQIAQMDKLRKELEEKLKEKDAEIERLRSENSAEWEFTFKELEKKYEALMKRFKDAETEKEAEIDHLKSANRQLEAKSRDKAKKGPADEQIETRKKELEKKYQDLEKKLADEQYEAQIAQMDKLRKELEEKLKEKDAEIERLRSENSAEWEFTFKELEKKYEALLKRFKDAEADKEAEIGQLKTNIRHLQAKSRDKAKKGPADEQIETRKKELEKKYQDLEKKLADEQYEAQIAQMDKLRKELEEKLKEKDAEIERLRSENSAEWEFTFKELEKKYEALMKRFKDAETEKEAEIDHLKSANRQLEAKSRDKAKKGPADEQIETRKKELEKKYQDLEKKLADEQYEAQIAQMDKLRKELEEKLKEKDAEIERLRSENSAEWEFTFKELEKKYEALLKRFKDAEAEKEAEIAHLKSANRQLEAKSRDKAKKGPADEQIETRKKELEKKYQDLEKKLADEQYEAQIAQMDKLRKELEEKLKEKDAEIERLRSENSAEWEFTFKELEKKYEALLKRFKDAEAEKEAEIAHLKSANRQLEAKSRDKAKKGPADEQIETRKKELEKKYQDLEKKLADEQYEAQIAQMDKLRKELEEKLKEKDAEIERLRSENSAEWEFTFKELEKKYEALLKRFKDAEAEKEAEIAHLKSANRQLEAKSRDKAKKGPADEQIETRKKELEKKYQDLEKKLADEQYEAQIAQMDKLRKELEEKLKEKDAEIERLRSENSAEWEFTFKELEKKYEALLKRFKDAEADKEAEIGQLKTNIRHLQAKSRDKAKKGPADEQIETRKKELEKKYQDLEKKLADEQYEAQIAQMDKLRKELEEKLKEKDAEIERLRSENSAEWEFTFKELEKKYEALMKRFKDAETEKEAEIDHLKSANRQLEAKSRDKAKKGPADEQIETRKKELEKKYQDLEKKLADEQYEAQIAQMDKLRKELEEKLKEKDAEIERLRSENSAEWEFTFKELEKKYEALMKRFKDAETEKEAEIDHLKSANRQLEAKSRDKAKKGPADEQIETRKKELEKKYQDLEKKLADEQYEAQIAQMDKLRKELEEKLKEKDAEIERLRSENSAEWEFTFKELEKKYEALLKRFKDAEAEKEAEIAHLKSANRQLEAKSRDKAKKGPADEQIETRKKELEKKYQDLEKKLADEQYEAQIAQMDKLRKELEEKLKEKDAEIERLRSENSAEWEFTFKELEKKYEALLKRFKDAEAEKEAEIAHLKSANRQLEAKSRDKAKKGPADEQIETRKKELEKKYQDLEKKLADEQYEAQIAQMDKLRKELEEKLKEKDAEIERLRSENSAEWEFTFKELEKKYEALLKRFKDAEADKEAEIGQLKTNIRHLQAKSRDKAKKGPADEQIETRKKELEKKYQDLEKKLADEQYEAQIAQMDKLRKELEEKLKEKDAEIERLRSENSAEWEFTFKELEKKYEALMKRFKDAETEKEAEIDHLKSANRQLEAKSRDKAKKGPADEQIETRKKELEKKYQDLEKKLADEQYEAQIAQMDKLRKELEEKLKEKDAEIERLRSENSAEWEFTFKELEKKYEALMKRFKDAEAEKEAEIAHLKSANRQLEAKSRDKAKKGPADEQIETRKKELEKKYQDLEKKLADEQYEAQIAQMDKLRKELEEKLKEKDAEIERLRSENSAEWEFTFKELEKKYEALMKRFKDAEAEKEAEIAHLKSANRQLEAKSRDKAKKGPADEQIETRKKELEKKYQDLEKKLADEQYEAQIAQMDKLRKELEEKLKEKDAEIERLRSENSAEWEFTFKELEKKYEALMKRFKDAEAEKEAEIAHLKSANRQLEAKSRDKAKKGPADEQIETRKKELEKKYQDLEKKLADEQYEAQIAQMDKLRKELEEKLKEKDAEIERLRSENSAEWEFTFKELEKKYEALLKRFKDAEADKEAEIGQLKTNIRHLQAKSRDKAKKGPADEQIETRKKELEKKYQDLEKKLADEQYEAQIAQMDKLRKELEEKLKEKDAEIERLRSENSAEWEFTFKELEKKYEALLKRFKDAEAEKEAEIAHLKSANRQLEAKSRDKAKKGPADEQIETRKKELEKKYQDLEKKLADEQYEAQIAQMDKLRKELEEKLKEKDAEIERLRSENSAEWEFTFKELEKKYEALMKRFKDAETEKEAEIAHLKSANRQLQTSQTSSQYEITFTKLQQEYYQVTERLQTKQRKISSLQQRILDLQNQLQQLQDLYNSSTSNEQLLSTIQFKYNTLLNTLSEKDSQLNHLKSINTDLQSKYTNLLSRQQPISQPLEPRDHIFIPIPQTELSHYRNLQSECQHLQQYLNRTKAELQKYKNRPEYHPHTKTYPVQTNISFKPADSTLVLQSLPNSPELRDLFFSNLLDQAINVSKTRGRPKDQHVVTQIEQDLGKLPVEGIQSLLQYQKPTISEQEAKNLKVSVARLSESERYLKNQLNETEQSLKKKDEHLKNQLKSQEDRMNKLAQFAQQNRKLKYRIQQLDMNTGQLEKRHETEMNRLRNEIQKLNNSLKQKEAKLKYQRQLKQHGSGKQRDTNLMLESLTGDNVRLQSEIDRLGQQNRIYRDKLAALEEQNEKYRQQLIIISQRMSQATQVYTSEIREKQEQIFQDERMSQESDGQSQQSQSQDYEYDEAELQILRRINLEVADLVEMNRRLQLKLVLLENQSHKNCGSCTDTVNYFLMLQARMEKLVAFLINKEYIKNGDLFANFSEKSNLHLLKSSHEEYMDSWLDFMKSLFGEVYLKKDNELRVKAVELNEIRERMTDMLENKMRKGSESVEQLHQYKMIQTDIRFLLREYMSTMDPEYLKMMCQSLGLEKF